MNFEAIENIRRVTGTLPSERPTKQTHFRHLPEALDITIEDHSANPYKAMFVAATSTWGDNKFEQKWPKTSLEGKLEVVKAVLTHNTLPQAREMINFLFRVNGVPRWLFDYHTQVPYITIMSIGCRDNNKVDSDVVFTHLPPHQEDWSIFEELKDLYEEALQQDQASWQTARTFLPQCYLHAYHFSQNLLAITGAKTKFSGQTVEEQSLAELYRQIKMKVHAKFPLIGFYLHTLTMPHEEVFKEIRSLQVSGLSVEDLNYFKRD